MEFKNTVEVRFPGIEECYLIANSNCALGKVYDYASALSSFAIQRMQEEEAKSKVEVTKEEITNPEG